MVSFLKLDLREHRAREMTMFVEECLYVCTHLGWVRKGDRNRVFRRRTFELGEARRRPLYKPHKVGTLCAAKR